MSTPLPETHRLITDPRVLTIFLALLVTIGSACENTTKNASSAATVTATGEAKAPVSTNTPQTAPTAAQPTAPVPVATVSSNSPAAGQPTAASASDGHKWYTSSAGNATRYYCDLDDGWKDIVPGNLREFQSEASLKAAFPTRTKLPASRC